MPIPEGFLGAPDRREGVPLCRPVEPSDPIQANHIAIFRSGQALEDASAPLDDGRRSNIVPVAISSSTGQTFLTSYLDCLFD